ncbi:GAF domain-containing protein [Telluribacter sp.]|jgi:hypothetical protein|uniref:GAF domain-containing protein n=1 Tax=Telluribacter sp. TaxID=1978767 RepID=UPI002E0E32E6|nr:GAF domain-containing protein [Telluribacter sp.]
MKPAPFPENEPNRLKALYGYNILDTLSEGVYDDITRLASEICGTPFSLITLVDKDRQWFKSKQGIELPETPREHSFCAHAILEPDEVFIVPDARFDDRFMDNPLTTGDPHIIFYAGVPLVDNDGHALGTLCILDSRPRELTDQKIMALKALANLVNVHFELRKTRLELERTLDKIKNVNEGLSAGDMKIQQIQPLLDPLLSDVETLLENDPRADQFQKLGSIQMVVHSLKRMVSDSDSAPAK